MTDTAGRLLSLLSLLQMPREWPGSELARRLGVSGRTVRRDVDRLRELGYPVEASMGAEGGYRLVAGTAMPPLLLDDEEAVAIAVGLRTAARQTVAGIEEASVRAMAKLEQVLPSRLRHRVAALQAATVALPGHGPVVSAEVLQLVAGACRDHHRLRFDYRSHDGDEGVRQVEPLKLVHTGRRWYLVGFDVDRDDWRTFRVDRMRPREPVGPRFTPRTPPDEDIARYTAFGVTNRVYRHQAVLRLLTSAERAAEFLTRQTGVLEPVDEESCLLRIGANSLDDLAVWVWFMGCEFEVVEPAELVGRMRALAERITRTCDRS